MPLATDKVIRRALLNVPLACNTPPPRVTPLAAAPRPLSARTWSTPSDTVLAVAAVAPVKVLTPDKIKEPEPVLVKELSVALLERMPLKVVAPCSMVTLNVRGSAVALF